MKIKGMWLCSLHNLSKGTHVKFEMKESQKITNHHGMCNNNALRQSFISQKFPLLFHFRPTRKNIYLRILILPSHCMLCYNIQSSQAHT